MHDRRYLIRFFSGGIENWRKDSPQIDTLAKMVFDLAESEHSVYEVASGEEECLAAAAHKLTDPKKGPEPISVLRIDKVHLIHFGINIETQFGTTGIPRWDARHRNLHADRPKLVDLVRLLAERYYRGHEEVRRIEKCFVIRSLAALCEYPCAQSPSHVKQIVQWCIGKESRPTLSIDQARSEIEVVEFDDDVIRPYAEQVPTGGDVARWFTGLRSARLEYGTQYLPNLAKRFGLGNVKDRSQVELSEIQ